MKRALERRGVAVEDSAPGTIRPRTFDGFDAVVLRSNWDYHFTPQAFLEWLGRREAAEIPVWNPPGLVRWNLSKRYLLDLSSAGLPVVPTVVVDGDAEQLPALLAERGWATAVVKPLVSASAHDTVLVPTADAPGVAAAIARGEIRTPVLVQPFVEEIRTRGEWSLVFIDGAFSHAALKHPAPHDFRVQPRLGGRAAAATPPLPVLTTAWSAYSRPLLPLPSLYARIDGVECRRGVPGDGGRAERAGPLLHARARGRGAPCPRHRAAPALRRAESANDCPGRCPVPWGAANHPSHRRPVVSGGRSVVRDEQGRATARGRERP